MSTAGPMASGANPLAQPGNRENADCRMRDCYALLLLLAWLVLSLFFCPRKGMRVDKKIFLEEYRALDYDDLVARAVRLMTRLPDFAEEVAGHFSAICVDEFQTFVKDLAMHIAASRPLGIQREDIPEDVVQREEQIYRAQAQEMGKPENILDKIVQGKMEKFYKESCLLEQQYIRDPDITG